ncbi:unnamed protein product [Trifolium pratense]|uniref:Uncharacterized protein n=1 Tax=Trifolium pratense TaxID=57577 RepID=A0ACB0L2Y9_TRIPR|nr:unnamed protein product [Trifolium pratense]
MLSRINQDNSLTEGGEEIPIDDGGRNIASENENKASQNLTSAEAHITVDLKNVNERLWEEFLKRVKKHDESEGMLKPPQIGEKVERRRLESTNATDVCVSDEPIARRERFNRTVGAQTAWGIQRARNRLGAHRNVWSGKAFHECGGNDSSDVLISLPQWALDIEKDTWDIVFTDREGRGNTECLSWEIDKEQALKGKTEIVVYFDMMTSFRILIDCVEYSICRLPPQCSKAKIVRMTQIIQSWLVKFPTVGSGGKDSASNDYSTRKVTGEATWKKDFTLLSQFRRFRL